MKRLWRFIAWLMYHGICIATHTRVRLVDDGGLAILSSDAPLLLAANHQSHADTPVIYHNLPPKIRRRLRILASAKRFGSQPHGRTLGAKLEHWVLHGLAVHAYHAILVGGESGHVLAVESIGEAVRAGDCVVVYPEGTRSVTGNLGALRLGVAIAALENNIPIVPMRIDGTHLGLPKTAYFMRFGSRLTLRIRAPIFPGHSESPAQLLARLRPQLEAAAHE